MASITLGVRGFLKKKKSPKNTLSPPFLSAIFSLQMCNVQGMDQRANKKKRKEKPVHVQVCSHLLLGVIYLHVRATRGSSPTWIGEI